MVKLDACLSTYNESEKSLFCWAFLHRPFCCKRSKEESIPIFSIPHIPMFTHCSHAFIPHILMFMYSMLHTSISYTLFSCYHTLYSHCSHTVSMLPYPIFPCSRTRCSIPLFHTFCSHASIPHVHMPFYLTLPWSHTPYLMVCMPKVLPSEVPHEAAVL